MSESVWFFKTDRDCRAHLVALLLELEHSPIALAGETDDRSDSRTDRDAER